MDQCIMDILFIKNILIKIYNLIGITYFIIQRTVFQKSKITSLIRPPFGPKIIGSNLNIGPISEVN